MLKQDSQSRGMQRQYTGNAGNIETASGAGKVVQHC